MLIFQLDWLRARVDLREIPVRRYIWNLEMAGEIIKEQCYCRKFLIHTNTTTLQTGARTLGQEGQVEGHLPPRKCK